MTESQFTPGELQLIVDALATHERHLRELGRRMRNHDFATAEASKELRKKALALMKVSGT